MRLDFSFLKTEEQMQEEYISINSICHRLKEPRVDVIKFLKNLSLRTISIPFGAQRAIYYHAKEIEPHLIAREMAKNHKEATPLLKLEPEFFAQEQLDRIEKKLDAILRDLNIKGE